MRASEVLQKCLSSSLEAMHALRTRTFFKNGFPARTFTGSTKLLAGAHFEITGVAIKSRK